MKVLLDSFKALGDPTRLRITLLLQHCELTTTELCGILGQTQPRVSRHLKLLVEAGILLRHAEGSKAFYRTSPSEPSRGLLEYVSHTLQPLEPQLVGDLDRLEQVRQARSTSATAYFSSVASEWDQLRSLHVSDKKVETTLLEMAGKDSFSTLVDIGTGTGRMLELFADRVAKAVGVDENAAMLNVARSNLDRPELQHCSVRKASAYSLELEPDSVDLAVFHHVLHFLDDPGRAICEAARVLEPGGQLLLVDFAAHKIERFRIDYSHRRLGFTDAEVDSWLQTAGLMLQQTVRFESDKDTKDEDTKENLTVIAWSAIADDHDIDPHQAGDEYAQI